MTLVCKIPLIYQKKWILHIDADAFFAAIEQSLNPRLKGKPIIIGGPTKTTGVVATASYEAKRYGVKSAMPMYQAIKLCPHAILVKSRMNIYKKYSNKMYEIFLSHTPYVQMVSIDEAFLDITNLVATYNETPENIAKLILIDVYQKLNISISCGCSSNKLISKIASTLNKPHKLTIIQHGSEDKFISKMPISIIPGVGPKMSKLLYKYGLKTPKNIIDCGLESLISILGKNSTNLWQKVHGIDNTPVKFSSSNQKSISKEQTFYEKYDTQYYKKTIKQLSLTIIKRLNESEMKAKTAFLKITYKNKNVHNFNSKHTYNINLGTLSSSYSVIFKVLNKLFLKNYDSSQNIRLIGVGVSNLKRNYNLDIFENTYKDEALTKCMHNMQKKYGNDVITFM